MQKSSLKLGLTIWSHNSWQKSFYGKGTKPGERLEKYSEVFNTVEGNTTFYATPSFQTVKAWDRATNESFKFTFKLPSQITHQNKLRNAQEPLNLFLKTMEPLFGKIGQWTIQLPSSFAPESLPALEAFCKLMPPEIKLGVEVRHLGFFAKDDNEKRFNQWLIENKINRIIMDSRPVFAAEPTSEAIIDAHQKKPRVPVHAIATADNPLIRFIGHPELEANDNFFEPWLMKVPQWINEGKQPYLMIHTPDNVQAPELAARLYKQIQQHADLTALNEFPVNKGNMPQLNMF